MYNGSIGVFDSGVGGLTVVRAIMEALPEESIIYYADSARAPYGQRPREEILRFALEITSYLVSRGAKAVAVACNTSSALAVPEISGEFDAPMIGMINCGARAAVRASEGGRIGIIATVNTVRSLAYTNAIGALDPDAFVTEQACPALVPMVERGEISGPRVREALRTYITPMMEQGVDTIVYGCTHYPFLDDEVRSLVGESVNLVDPAAEVATELRTTLAANRGRALGDSNSASIEFVTSGDEQAFAGLVHLLLGWKVTDVSKVRLGRAGDYGACDQPDVEVCDDAPYDSRE